MPLFSKVCLHCNVCARPILTDFSRWGGRFCDQICCDEYNLRRAHAIMGEGGKEEPFVREESPNG